MNIDEWMGFTLFTLGSYSLNLGALLFALALLTATFIISKLIQRTITRLSHLRPSLTPSIVYIFNRIVHYVVLVVGLLLVASALGIDITKLAIVGGALGIGIGLGLQGIVNNFFSGIIIMLDRSLKVGDFIELSDGLVGEVLRINVRSTVVRTNDYIDVLVPNAEFVSARLTNWTLDENIRRFRVPFGVAYGSDKELVKKATIEAAHKVELTLSSPNREPAVWMTGFGDSSLNFVLAVWVHAEAVKRPSFLMSEYLWAIDDAFRQYNIEIPFPQRDLHLRSGVPSLEAAGNN